MKNHGGGAYLAAYKIISTFIALAFLILFDGYLRASLLESHYTIHNDFFPAIFNSNGAALAVFWLLVFLAVAVVVLENAVLRSVFPVLLMAGSLFLLSHQQGFFVQGFVASFWASIPLLWLNHAHAHPETGSNPALALKLCIAIMFLGAFLGKLNDFYWSGEAFTRLGFPRFTGSPAIVVFFSRAAIISEGLLVVIGFLPARISFPIATAMITSMWLLTDYSIINALGPVLGTALGGTVIEHKKLSSLVGTRWRAIIACACICIIVFLLRPVSTGVFEVLRKILPQ